MTAWSYLVDEFLDGYFRLNPIAATLAGIHDQDHRLGDHSRAGFAERDDFARAWDRRLAAVGEADLSAEEQVDREVLLATLRGAIALQPYRAWTRRPSLYVWSITTGAYALLVHDFAPLEERLQRIAERLSQTGAVLEAAKANLDPDRTAPVHVVVAGEAAGAGARFVRAELPSIAPEGPAKRDVLVAGREAGDALERFALWLRDELMDRARGSFAIGRDTLDALLRRQHLLDHDAASLVKLGREVYRETEAQLVSAARQLGSGDWTAVVAELKRDHPGADDLLDAYRTEMARARAAVRELDLVTFPDRDELEVVSTPDFRRPTTPYAAYFPPAPFDAARKGYFFVTLPDPTLPEAVRTAALEGHMWKGIAVTAAHEAYPGHHLQLTLAADHPSKVRKAFWTPFLVEGWGLYCEELMREERYLSEPATQVLQLKDLLWRAGRIIVDIGLATGELNFEQAVRFLVEGPRLERPNAIAEVRRYTLTPTQPMSYMVGRLEILRLREKARAKGLGLKAFHDRLLALGSIPPALAARQLAL